MLPSCKDMLRKEMRKLDEKLMVIELSPKSEVASRCRSNEVLG
jgi:hypothetical protein